MTIPVLHIYLQHENNAPFWYEQLIYFLALVSSSACYPELYDLYDRSHMGLDWFSDHLLMSNQGDIYASHFVLHRNTFRSTLLNSFTTLSHPPHSYPKILPPQNGPLSYHLPVRSPSSPSTTAMPRHQIL